MAPVKPGTSLHFLFPTSPQTHGAFRRALAPAARAAGLDGLLVGDNHAVPAAYATCFAPMPSLARLMAVTGDMPVGMVLLAPFSYGPERVTGKAPGGVVTLEMDGINQRGEIIVSGTAEVVLPTR
jgi:alkanesulfonate monooxygenase SsuD/methylene tetrahydromethanopterin reductase-like flavin-dependent oxidoreductase (luciferase family)